MEHVIETLLKDFESGKMSRRQLIQSLALAATAASGARVATAAADGKGFKTVELNHISYQCNDYRVARDFYVDLMGMKVVADTWRGRPECVLTWGRGPASYFVMRNHPVPQGQTAAPDAKPVVDHLSFTIANWDKNAVAAELKRRNLEARSDTDDSFIIKDAAGYTLQINGPGLSADSSTYQPKG